MALAPVGPVVVCSWVENSHDWLMIVTNHDALDWVGLGGKFPKV